MAGKMFLGNCAASLSASAASLLKTVSDAYEQELRVKVCGRLAVDGFSDSAANYSTGV